MDGSDTEAVLLSSKMCVFAPLRQTVKVPTVPTGPGHNSVTILATSQFFLSPPHEGSCTIPFPPSRASTLRLLRRHANAIEQYTNGTLSTESTRNVEFATVRPMIWRPQLDCDTTKEHLVRFTAY
jgi:hypothetical protein